MSELMTLRIRASVYPRVMDAFIFYYCGAPSDRSPAITAQLFVSFCEKEAYSWVQNSLHPMTDSPAEVEAITKSIAKQIAVFLVDRHKLNAAAAAATPQSP